MTRPPYFSEIANRYRLYDCEFADSACAVRRYCTRILLCGLELDPTPFISFFPQASVDTAVEREWRLVAMGSPKIYTIVALAGWTLPLAAVTPVVADDGVVLDFDLRRCFDRRHLP